MTAIHSGQMPVDFEERFDARSLVSAQSTAEPYEPEHEIGTLRRRRTSAGALMDRIRAAANGDHLAATIEQGTPRRNRCAAVPYPKAGTPTNV